MIRTSKALAIGLVLAGLGTSTFAVAQDNANAKKPDQTQSKRKMMQSDGMGMMPMMKMMETCNKMMQSMMDHPPLKSDEQKG